MKQTKMEKRYEQERFRLIFENSPIAIWEEDISALALLQKHLQDRTVTNIRKYLIEHPQLVKKTFRGIRILDVNKAALKLYGAKTKEELVTNLGKTFTKNTLDILINEFSALLEGKTFFEAEFKSRTIQGVLYDVFMKVSLPDEHKKTFSRVVVTMQDISERKRLERYLRRIAQLDSLTKLYNHNTINQRLEAEFIRAKRYGSSLSCMMIDLDHFKIINDEYGHQKGDRIIYQVASTLKSSIRQVDIIGRYGGDEFLVILPETKAQNARMAALRIQQIFTQKQFLISKGTSIRIALSIGISGFPEKGVKASRDMVARADKAMYQAKNAGRNRIAIL
ncbi:MAG: sensor domain-containing diguanylate cyclase [Candidatus Omnitrophota bacterium]